MLAIEEQSVNERNITGTTIPFHPDLLVEAKVIIDEFHKQMVELAKKKSPTEVYQVEVSLFRLTKANNERKAESHE
jgi:hypothetical protein